tara:strand:+ start:486 stop:770 length:285 start_codon:yes stop_codon:yes gene_type:complete
MKLISITKATDGKHKYQALFDIDGKKKTTKFGAVGYDDFTKTKDIYQREAYLARHRTREDWNNPTSAGALSRWILWNEPTLSMSIKDYKKRFKL